MREILGLTDASKQEFNIVITGYDTAQIAIEYKPNQYGWFMNLDWGNFHLYGERLSVADNLLRQFREIIPFGIAIAGVDGLDPLTPDCWLTTHKFISLDSQDIIDVEAYYAK